MKIFTRVVTVCLVFVMLCGMGMHASFDSLSESEYYGPFNDLPYPVHSRFTSKFANDKKGYFGWREDSFATSMRHNHTELEILSSLWLMYYQLGDTDVWPQIYLDRFENVLKNVVTDSSLIGDHRVDSYTWNGDILSLQCSADYDVKYTIVYNEYSYSEDDKLYVRAYGGYRLRLVFVITDKEDGKLVNMASVLTDMGDKYCPDYEYNFELPEDKTPEDYHNLEETIVETTSVQVQMPDFFDPDKYDITIYFETDACGCGGIFCCYIDERYFHNPHLISTDGYGISAPDTTTEPEPDVTTSEPETEAVTTEPAPVITTTEPEPIPDPEPVIGDVNGDGLLDLADVILSMKHIAGWDVTANVSLGNLNTNDRLDMEDVTTMMKLIAGWDISL